jgi:hypothetical protein
VERPGKAHSRGPEGRPEADIQASTLEGMY